MSTCSAVESCFRATRNRDNTRPLEKNNQRAHHYPLVPGRSVSKQERRPRHEIPHGLLTFVQLSLPIVVVRVAGPGRCDASAGGSPYEPGEGPRHNVADRTSYPKGGDEPQVIAVVFPGRTERRRPCRRRLICHMSQCGAIDGGG